MFNINRSTPSIETRTKTPQLIASSKALLNAPSSPNTTDNTRSAFNCSTEINRGYPFCLSNNQIALNTNLTKPKSSIRAKTLPKTAFGTRVMA